MFLLFADGRLKAVKGVYHSGISALDHIMGSSLSLGYSPAEKDNNFWNLNLSHCFLRQFPVDFSEKLDSVRKLDLSFNRNFIKFKSRLY
jgi:hypothetical protein